MKALCQVCGKQATQTCQFCGATVCGNCLLPSGFCKLCKGRKI